jgi:arylsulfatase A-like enzyme
MEGKSLVAAFNNQPIDREAIYWEHEGNAAIRSGDMKLVRKGGEGSWELYDLKADRTELHDLAPANPETAENLAAQWEDWAARAHVTPYPPEKTKKKKAKAK